ncbi:MAG: hypothetical protein ABSD67_24100 [Terracidiphilus sp.]
MIRQAISCDICGAEKRQTNHWFVASEHSGELRVSGWNSRNRLRPGSKHLCGQTCLHKLMDDFMARDVASRMQRGMVDEGEVEERAVGTDASLTSNAAYEDTESSVRLLPAVTPSLPKRLPVRVGTEGSSASGLRADLVAMPGRSQADAPMPPAVPTLEERPSYRSRNWRAEAWDREREREMRAVERRPDIAARRRSGS